MTAFESLFADCFAESDPAAESVCVAHFNADADCIHLSRHTGDTWGVDFPLRDIIADVVQLGSTSIIIAHNHPSGDCRPSDADCRATRRLLSAAEAIDCKVVDHLVFAGNECTSFRTLGLL